MNVNLDPEQNKISNKMVIIYISIIVVCVMSLIMAFVVLSGQEKPDPTPTVPQVGDDQNEKYKEEFNNIFNNKVNYMEGNSYKITKVEKEQEIIYTGYNVQEKRVNDYELDVNIPYINIVSDTASEFNDQIKDTFEKKAKSVLNSSNNNVIYTVDYSAYLTNNILSLVVRSTLREGNNPQRDIVQTYNYDLTNQTEYTMENFLELKDITKQQANQKIKQEIKRVHQNLSQLSALGYSVYERNPDDDMYSINNVTEYFIGEDNVLYIIFAYGNQNHTNEMDIVVI